MKLTLAALCSLFAAQLIHAEPAAPLIATLKGGAERARLTQLAENGELTVTLMDGSTRLLQVAPRNLSVLRDIAVTLSKAPLNIVKHDRICFLAGPPNGFPELLVAVADQPEPVTVLTADSCAIFRHVTPASADDLAQAQQLEFALTLLARQAIGN